MERLVKIVIWIVLFLAVVGVAEYSLNAIVSDDLDKYTGPVAIILGWWVAELVRKKRQRPDGVKTDVN